MRNLPKVPQKNKSVPILVNSDGPSAWGRLQGVKVASDGVKLCHKR